MKTELERYKKALAYVIEWHVPAGDAQIMKDRVDIILNPPPELETVEVVRWESVNAHGLREWTTFEDDARMWAERGQEVIILTGTIIRPKPQKVERSVTIETAIHPDGVIYTSCPTPIQPFMQHSVTFGKTGTLTFTWAE